MYADLLEGHGELRGELITIDLRIEEDGPLPPLVKRRKELLAAWLRSLPPGKVQHGFLDVDATGPDPVDQIRAALETGGAPYIRTIAVVGAPATLREAVGVIAAEPRPSLVRIVLRHGARVRVDAAHERARAARQGERPASTRSSSTATDLRGGVHPALQRLRISAGARSNRCGATARHGRCSRSSTSRSRVTSERATCATAKPRAAVRSPLRRGAGLDLSRNEPGETDPVNLGGSTNVFAFLRRLEIRRKLRELRMPTVLTDVHLQDLRGALPELPALVQLTIRGARQPIDHPIARITYV